MSVELMRQYQKEATVFSINNPASYQALDMGMGKTLIAITWAANIMRIDPRIPGVLVMAPLSTVYTTWPDEIKKWRPDMTHTILHGDTKDANLRDNVDFYIVNFDGIKWLWDAIKRYFKIHGVMPFRALILDEGSMVKNPRTKRFQILKKMMPLFPKWKVILSGTPAPNTLLELWPQYFLLDKGRRLGQTITGYKRSHFFQVDRMGFVWKIRPGEDTPIYDKIKDITYRLDAKDYLDLPKRIDNVIKVKLPDNRVKEYLTLEKLFFTELEELDDNIEAFNAMSLSMKLRQFCQGAIYDPEDIDLAADQRRVIPLHDAKLKALIDLVETSPGKPILCAIQFRFELAMIRKKFPKAPVIAGGVNQNEKTRLIKLWNKGKIPLLLCHPASLSHGVNLQTGGNIILWYGIPWSLEQYLQFNARLHRFGQLNTVFVHHLLVSGTIDEKIYLALKNKFKSQEELLNYLKGSTNDKANISTS